MADHLEDDEQVEALKRWWDENGRSTVVAVVLAVAGTLGWQQYQGYTADQAAMAADAWQTIQLKLDSEVEADQDEAEQLAEALKSAHGGTAYARFAAMRLAAIAVKNGDLDAAETQLRWALTKEGSTSELGQLLQLRLARVLAASGDEAAALAILEAGSNAYSAAYAIARGDIHLASGRQQPALDAYREARAAMLALGNPPGILDTKITSLESRLASAENAS